MQEAWLREPFFDIDLEPLLTLGPFPAPSWGRNRVEKAYLAYQTGDYPLALEQWRQEIARKPERLDLRFHRAHTFYWMAQYDSAIVELRAAIAAMMPADTATWSLVPRTDVLYYAIGIAYERAGQPDSAKEAYSQALVANLGIYMAHARLSNIFLAEGDSAKALQEVLVALDVAPREALFIAHYGSVLLRIGRFAEALEQLRTATTISPRYAAPYFLIGMAYRGLGRSRDALRSFDVFLSSASQRDQLRPVAVEQIAQLRASLADSAGPRE